MSIDRRIDRLAALLGQQDVEEELTDVEIAKRVLHALSGVICGHRSPSKQDLAIAGKLARDGEKAEDVIDRLQQMHETEKRQHREQVLKDWQRPGDANDPARDFAGILGDTQHTCVVHQGAVRRRRRSPTSQP